MIKIKSLHTKAPRYITRTSRMDVGGFLLTATSISIPENTEYVYRFENGVHIWETKKGGSENE